VLVVLGFGIVDLFNHASKLTHAHALPSGWGDVATTAYWFAIVAAVAAVAQLSRALFPRHRAEQASLFYFGLAATFPTADEYARTLDAMSPDELERNLASQAWHLAGIAQEKFASTRRAYYALMLFFAFWGVARITLAIAR
jgi:hypothetical protein